MTTQPQAAEARRRGPAPAANEALLLAEQIDDSRDADEFVTVLVDILGAAQVS